jgi:hypothetical protein
LTSQALAPGAPQFVTHDVTQFSTDVYVLTGSDAGTWTRTYTATDVSPDGTRKPNNGSLSGTYSRSSTQITLMRTGGTPLTAQFTGRGMTIIEGDFLLTYALR